MSDFFPAVTLTLKHEGGYVDNSSDPGGATNFGISQRAHPEVDIQMLTREHAIDIYRNDYWQPEFERVPDQRLANSLFDFCVNAGPDRAIKTLQKNIARHVAGPLVVDGKFGPKTLESMYSCQYDDLLTDFTASRIVFYASLGKPQFLEGWVRRALDY